MNRDRALHAVMLSELPHVGDAAAARILTRNVQRQHGLATFFRLPAAVLHTDYQLHAGAVRRVCAEGPAHESRCCWLLEQLTAAGGWVCTTEDDTYPAHIRQRLRPPPAVLYGMGNRGVACAPTLAVLNSRTVTEHSASASIAAVEAAAAHGFTLVSGGMKTGYRIAAVAGRAGGASRVIVLDRGLFAAFGARLDREPFGFGPGRAPLDQDRTLVLSPFRLLDHASPRSGQRRDELVAALADVIIAVHARSGGQMERVCLAALDRGQCVLSWYGENPGLVAAGARPITEADLPASLLPSTAR